MKWIKISKLCKMLDVSYSTFKKHIESGTYQEGIHYIHTPFGMRFNLKAIEEFSFKSDEQVEKMLKNLLTF